MTGCCAADNLAFERLTKDFSGLRALEAVSFTLDRGEIVGLIGPNGSGKTTLINVATGVLAPTSGSVVSCGHDITGMPSFRIARAGLARTFQTVRLFRHLTVRENVEVGALSVGKSRREARRVAAEAIAELGIEHWSEELASVLPYGDERRVEVARALGMTPDFLLLDEPAAGLNEQESSELLEILAPIPERRKLGMLVVDHDMHLIMRLCHRLHVLNYGRTIGEGTPEQIRRIPEVVAAYLGSSAQERPGAQP